MRAHVLRGARLFGSIPLGGFEPRWSDLDVATLLRRAVESCDPLPGFERYMLAHHSVPVLGDPAPFAPDSMAAVARHQTWLTDLLARPAESHSSVMLAGILQELARTIVFFRDGRFLAKTKALEEEIATDGPFAPAYAIALRVRREGSARADGHRDELAAAYTAVGTAARELVDRLLAALVREPSAMGEQRKQKKRDRHRGASPPKDRGR